MKKYLLTIAISTSVLMANSLTTDEIQTKAILKLMKQNELLESRIVVLERKNAEIENEKAKIVVNTLIKEENIESISIPKTRIRAKETTTTNNSNQKLFYFTPTNLVSVREEPYEKAKYVSSIRSGNKIEIVEIFCKKNIGYWGKSSRGWIYISNPKYGHLSNAQGEKLQQEYHHWCSEEQ